MGTQRREEVEKKQRAAGGYLAHASPNPVSNLTYAFISRHGFTYLHKLAGRIEGCQTFILVVTSAAVSEGGGWEQQQQQQ